MQEVAFACEGWESFILGLRFTTQYHPDKNSDDRIRTRARAPLNQHTLSTVAAYRFRAKMEPLKTLRGLSPEIQCHNPTLTVLCVPYSLKSALSHCASSGREESVDADTTLQPLTLILRPQTPNPEPGTLNPEP